MKRNISLFLILLISSIILAYPVGSLIDQYTHFDSGGFGDVGPSQSDIEFLDGLIFSYLVISSFLFSVWGKGRKFILVSLVSILGFIIPIWVGGSYLGWSLIFFFSGIAIAAIVNAVRRGAIVEGK